MQAALRRRLACSLARIPLYCRRIATGLIDRMKKNKDLRRFYDGVYKKGERRHYYSKRALSEDALSNEDREVIKAMAWRGKSVLDVGCGTGRACHEIAARGAKRVVGIDFSAAAIAKARARPARDNLEYRVEALAAHKGRYDMVISLGTLEHTDDPYAVLQDFKDRLHRGGAIILTCPNWTNPRGYVLQTLLRLFDAPITLADLHSLTPIEFIAWAKELNMQLTWHTFDHDWAHGERLIADLTQRLPNVLRDAKLPHKKKNVAGLIEWLELHVLPLDHTSTFSGATGLYLFEQKK